MACAGRVKFFLPDKGWGRLEVTGALPPELPPADAANGIFVHYKDVAVVDDKTLASLEEGQEVCFNITKGERGWQASDVRGLDGAPVRTRLHRNLLGGLFSGVVTHWNSEKAFGWISAELSPQVLGMQRVPKAVLALNEGRVYFRWRDCGAGPLRDGQQPAVPRGKPVVFQLYWDEKGLGATQVCDAMTLRPLGSLAASADHYKLLLALQDMPSGEQQLEELAKELDKCTICLVVLRSQAGSIIGQRGETVRELKEKTGVERISVENGASDVRLVELRGSPAAVVAAVLAVMEHLCTKDPKVQDQPSAPDSATPEVRLAVPDDGFGRVVGKGKAQLEAIRSRCPGVVLEIAPRVSTSIGAVQAISVTGELAAAAEAVRLLVVRIATCCSAIPLPRGPPGPAMAGQSWGPMGAMLALQVQMAAAAAQQGSPYGLAGKGWVGGRSPALPSKGGGKPSGGKPGGCAAPRPPAALPAAPPTPLAQAPLYTNGAHGPPPPLPAVQVHGMAF